MIGCALIADRPLVTTLVNVDLFGRCRRCPAWWRPSATSHRHPSTEPSGLRAHVRGGHLLLVQVRISSANGLVLALRIRHSWVDESCPTLHHRRNERPGRSHPLTTLVVRPRLVRHRCPVHHGSLHPRCRTLLADACGHDCSQLPPREPPGALLLLFQRTSSGNTPDAGAGASARRLGLLLLWARLVPTRWRREWVWLQLLSSCRD